MTDPKEYAASVQRYNAAQKQRGDYPIEAIYKARNEGMIAMWSWTPISQKPEDNGSYLVYMPERSLDRYSVQDWDHREDSFSNDFGITHWCKLPEPPHVFGPMVDPFQDQLS